MEDAKWAFYSAWLFPWVLDLVMQQKQLKPFRERIGKTASGRVFEGYWPRAGRNW